VFSTKPAEVDAVTVNDPESNLILTIELENNAVDIRFAPAEAP
jgi:hypothetical protein